MKKVIYVDLDSKPRIIYIDVDGLWVPTKKELDEIRDQVNRL